MSENELFYGTKANSPFFKDAVESELSKVQAAFASGLKNFDADGNNKLNYPELARATLAAPPNESEHMNFLSLRFDAIKGIGDTNPDTKNSELAARDITTVKSYFLDPEKQKNLWKSELNQEFSKERDQSMTAAALKYGALWLAVAPVATRWVPQPYKLPFLVGTAGLAAAGAKTSAQMSELALDKRIDELVDNKTRNAEKAGGYLNSVARYRSLCLDNGQKLAEALTIEMSNFDLNRDGKLDKVELEAAVDAGKGSKYTKFFLDNYKDLEVLADPSITRLMKNPDDLGLTIHTVDRIERIGRYGTIYDPTIIHNILRREDCEFEAWRSGLLKGGAVAGAGMLGMCLASKFLTGKPKMIAQCTIAGTSMLYGGMVAGETRLEASRQLQNAEDRIRQSVNNLKSKF